MPSVDEILKSPALPPLQRVSDRGGDRTVREVRVVERLGPKRMETAVRTLKTYLDEQCSIVRTARALHLHRNAVSYRLQRIFELLEVDPSDPDQRLALQLACRARLLG